MRAINQPPLSSHERMWVQRVAQQTPSKYCESREPGLRLIGELGLNRGSRRLWDINCIYC